MSAEHRKDSQQYSFVHTVDSALLAELVGDNSFDLGIENSEKGDCLLFQVETHMCFGFSDFPVRGAYSKWRTKMSAEQ